MIFTVKHVLCSDISKGLQEVTTLWYYLFDEEEKWLKEGWKRRLVI